MLARSQLIKVAAAAAVLVVVTGGAVGYVGYSYSQSPPQVKSVNTQWGDVTEEETEVETEVTVNNPNPVGIPGVIGLEYTTKLNGVTVIEGEKSSVGLDSGENEITIPATMENQAIARWWVSHVNNGEQSTMTVTANVSAPGGVERTLISRESKFQTNMLDSMSASGSRTVTLQGEEFIILQDQSASWGEADMESTPVQFSATIQNAHEYPLTLDGVGYVIRMNNVTVGEGRTTEGLNIEPGSSGTLEVNAAIETPKMADWWASHVRKNETTQMKVALYGLVERNGELKRVPFELFERDILFTTNMLEGGGANMQPAQGESDSGPSYQQPEVVDSTRQWGEVTDETTTIESTVVVDNPNNGTINDFVTLSAGQRVTINDIVVADGSTDLGSLDPGRNELDASTKMNNSKVPQWWARHVNNGEQSTVVIEPTTTANLGFTKFGVGLSGSESTVETNMLAGINTDETQDLTTEGGTKVAELRRVESEWGEADTEESPIIVTATIKNTFDTEITLTDLQYTISLNEVKAGEGTAPESYTIQSGNTRTVTFTLVIDSQKMDEWWQSHVRNGESTAVDVTASIRVDTPVGSDRANVDALTDNRNVTTDFLGSDDS